jgi:lipoprotein-anchoring transpeptidase ErfK/SrfK
MNSQGDPLKNREMAHLLVQEAMLALAQHRDDEARNLARQAAQLAPDMESAWLVLASVSSPQAAEVYLKKALEINPASEQAQQGMDWLHSQRNKEDPENPFRLPPIPIPRSETPHYEEEPPRSKMEVEYEPYPPEAVFPPKPEPTRAKKADMLPDYQNIEAGRLYSRKVIWWPWVLVAIAMILGVVVWMFIPPFQTASASNLRVKRQQGEIIKPTLTPTATATFTPSPTSTPTEMPTVTPTQTETEALLEVVSTEEEFYPEFVYEEGDTELSEQDVKSGERWIDVNLSDQTVSAYEGDELLDTFLVSTGTSAHPTVTGRFHIYVKYRYTDMSGPGYYLPDVPYTMYFHDGYGLHGTYWHHNFGTPMSHGCVNLRTEDAAWLYDWASEGTVVNVHY